MFLTSAVWGTFNNCSPQFDDQYVKVVFVEWKPSNGPITVSGLRDVTLNQTEIAQLEKAGVRGQFKVVGLAGHGKKKGQDATEAKRILIVMQHQIAKTVNLPQPDQTDAIYLQNGDEWKLLPDGIPTVDRFITLEVNKQYPNQTMYRFQLRNGATEGMSAFDW